MNLQDLKAPLPTIHWRAQSLTRDGTKAMALAYMDARDVMDRLDTVCGPENWQDSYVESAKGRVICTISIRVGDTWVSKSDGAGDTAVEGEKGGISDAFKRAAVKWGIGRYLYDMPTPWAECETYERNGKKVFSKWTQSGWRTLKAIEGDKPSIAESVTEPKLPADVTDLIAKVQEAKTLDELQALWKKQGASFQETPHKAIVNDAFNKHPLKQKAA